MDSKGPQSDLLHLQKLENLKNSSRDVETNGDIRPNGVLHLAEERTRLDLSTATSTASMFRADEDAAAQP